MIEFEIDYFQSFIFNENQLKKYLEAAKHNLDIAEKTEIPEVIFDFSYQALIQFGIAVIAQKGYKVRSIPGHHVKILEKMSLIIENNDIDFFGNKMRRLRNKGLYDGVVNLISLKDAQDLYQFVKNILDKTNFWYFEHKLIS